MTGRSEHPRLHVNSVPFDEVFEQEKPDWVVVEGEILQRLSAPGSLHFIRALGWPMSEAGLRTGDLASPFPEEPARSLLGRITTFIVRRRMQLKLLCVSKTFRPMPLL